MLKHEVTTAVRQADQFLLAHQDAEGMWRDYDLEPGRSEAWTTACVGWALERPPAAESSRDALARGAAALLRIRKPQGWSYNRETAVDADSTAWAIRLLAALDAFGELSPVEFLLPFLNPGGGARTFLSAERFGSWGAVHSDVTPVVGLALIAAAAPRQVVETVREAVLAARVPNSGWNAFWWSCDAYATAQNLELLAASGGIPRDVRRQVAACLATADDPATPFEAAQHLTIAVRLSGPRSPLAFRLVERLLAWRSADHGWPPSPVLQVPQQANPAHASIHADREGLMTSAMAVGALKGWLAAG